jgi:CubicO group peptidase (beta-lactamase class C family)
LAAGISFDRNGKTVYKVNFRFLKPVHISLLALLFVVAVGCQTKDTWNEVLSRQLLRDTSMKQIDTAILNFMRTYDIPAISVAVGKDDRMIYLKAFGQANLSDNIEADTQSLFRIIQTSMTVTSLATKILIDEGRINYDSKVFGNGGILGFEYGKNRYSEWLTEITIGDLLANKAGGWSGEDDVIADRNFMQSFWSKNAAMSWALDNVPLKSAPGDSSRFSEFSYFILGRVIEKLSGMPYENYVKKNVLQPAGITDMELGWDSAARPHEVTYYFPSPTPSSLKDLFKPRANGALHENLYLSRGDAALGWIASAGDLVKLMIKYKTLNSPDDNSIFAQTTSSTGGFKADNGFHFDWCSTDSTQDWWLMFDFLGSSTIIARSHGFSCAILINTFRPDKSAFFPNLMRIIKSIK